MNSELNPKTELVCAIDLGGTHLRAANIDRTGRINFRVRHQTPVTASPAKILDAIAAAVHQCKNDAELVGASLKAISLVIPGTVDAGTGLAIKIPNVPCLDGFDLADALTRASHLRAVLENDANAAVLGEMWRGAGRGCSSIVCLTLGTGVGGGIVVDGKLWRGANHSAGEIGHMCLEPQGVGCACGSRGCLEVYASATGIVRMANEFLAGDSNSVLADNDQLTSESVYAAAMRGDELALRVFRSMGSYLGVGLANVINLLDPQIVIIGGGVASAWEIFAQPMRDAIAARTFSSLATTRIVRAECGDDAGLMGAAYLAFSRGDVAAA